MNCTYTLTVSDDCSSITCAVTVAEPPSISKPAATVTQPTCTTATGTVTITSPATDVTYELKQAGVVKYTAVNGVFSSVVSGTYNFIATKGICSKAGDDVTVNAQPGTPAEQLTSVLEHVPKARPTDGPIMIAIFVIEQFFESVIVTVYVPAARFVRSLELLDPGTSLQS